MDINDLKNYVLNNPNLVRMKEYDGKFVIKYTKRVFYDNLWNEYLQECRGLVVDKDFNIISYPFTKIYNYGIEENSPVIAVDTLVDAYRKINGFMVAMTYHDGKILVSTTGSLDSPYVIMAKDYINHDVYLPFLEEHKDMTFMFECVHPNDPHIIVEKAGLYLLGYRQKIIGSDVRPKPMTLKFFENRLATNYVEHQKITLKNLIRLAKTVKHEGYVFYTNDGISSKIKSSYYLVKKFVARNPRTDKLMRMDIKKQIDEEYWPLIDAIRSNIDEYTLMDEQARLAWVREFLEKQ